MKRFWRGVTHQKKKKAEKAIRSTHPISFPGRKHIKRKPKALKGSYQTPKKSSTTDHPPSHSPPSPCIKWGLNRFTAIWDWSTMICWYTYLSRSMISAAIPLSINDLWLAILTWVVNLGIDQFVLKHTHNTHTTPKRATINNVPSWQELKQLLHITTIPLNTLREGGAGKGRGLGKKQGRATKWKLF